MNLPSATVTFLFTDIEGSTRLWEHFPDAMQEALAHHDRILREGIEREGGTVFKTVGDAFYAVFSSATGALAAALRAQRRLLEEPWPPETPIKVRMALHTGAAEHRDNDYFGQPLNRVSRVLALGHGGQTLLSRIACELVQDRLPSGASLKPLGDHRLKDLPRPESIFQLVHASLPDAFPPLKSQDLPDLLSNVEPSTEFFTGRNADLEWLKDRFENVATVTTLVVHALGGVGKTSLAVKYAAECAERYSALLFVAIGDRGTYRQEMAGLYATLTPKGQAHSQEQRLEEVMNWLYLYPRWLLILDNADSPEEIKSFFEEVAWFRHGHVLITSRKSFGKWKQCEHRALTTLSRDEAVEFLYLRSGRDRNAEGADELKACAQIAAELGALPLALEQAAARMTPDNRRPLSFRQYLSRYRALRREGANIRLLDEMNIDTGRYRRTSSERDKYLSVATTWDINFQEIRERYPASEEILRIASFLDPDGLFVELFIAARSLLTPRVREHFGRYRQADEDLVAELAEQLFGPLASSFLVQWNPRRGCYSMHRLVQDVVRDHIRIEARRARTQGVAAMGETWWAEAAGRLVNVALADPRMEQMAAPHAYYLAEILRPWINAEQEAGPSEHEEADGVPSGQIVWTDRNWASAQLPGDISPFRDYYSDHLVMLSQDGEVDWDTLIYGKESPTYRMLHRIQEPYWQGRMRRMIRAIGRVTDGPDTSSRRRARTLFLCVYFVVHYWWDLYLEGESIGVPILDAWRDAHGDGEEAELLEALEQFANNYPAARNYKERATPAGRPRWILVRDALRRLREILEIENGLPERAIAAERYAYAITCVYLAEALQYAPDGTERDDATIDVLYETAKLAYRADDDDFHYRWALRDQAEAHSQREDAGGLAPSMGLAEQAITLTLKAKRVDAQEDLDAEIIASLYRIQADIAWRIGQEAAAWGLLAAAVVTAYFWRDVWNGECERYSFEFYGENVDRMMDRFEVAANSDNASLPRVLLFIGEIWGMKPLSGDGARFDGRQWRNRLFPPRPSVDTIDTLRPDARAKLQRLLENIDKIASEFPDAPLPPTLLEVLTHLRDEFPA